MVRLNQISKIKFPKANCDSLSSMPFKVLFISHDGGMAGAQQTLLSLLEGLDRSVFHPFLVVPNQGELADRAMTLSIPVITRSILHWAPCVSNADRKEKWKYLWRSLSSAKTRAWSIAALIQRYEIDLVYTNTAICFEGALASWMTNKPHIWHIHEPLKKNSELFLLLPSWVYSMVVGKLSASIIFPSYALAKSYPALRKKSVIIHNGLDLSHKMDKSAARDTVAKELDIDRSKKWVAVVGALQPRKDHLNFLLAAKFMLEQRDDVEFLIVGSGSMTLTKQLQDQVNDLALTNKVKLVGRWLGSIETVLSALDVLVVSSEQESFGLTIIEAFAMETPVVSTRCGGPEEIIEDGKNGYLIDIKNPLALGKAVLCLLSNPQLGEQFGKAGRIKALTQFTREIYVTGIQNTIKEALH